MEQPFIPAAHHDILVFLIQIALLLLAARAFGEIFQRLGQPSVIGELLAGVVLGPSIVGRLFPFLEEWIIPQTPVQGYLLELIGLLGAMFLLLITGLETDLTLIRRHARTAVGVSLGGIVLSFATGFMVGQLLPDNLLANAEKRTVFALFVATTLAIASIPVVAKVLFELNLIRRDVGQTIIAAGMVDDTIGWILLSIFAGLAGSGAITAGTVIESVGSVLFFLLFSFTVGAWVVKRVFIFVQDKVRSVEKNLSIVVILMFVWASISQALHIEAVLGAFIMGILFSQIPTLPEDVVHKLESVALGIFAPIFFAIAGLKVNIGLLAERNLIWVALLLVILVSITKISGAYLGARLIGRQKHWTALGLGAGLNAQGAIGIIVATIALDLGVFSQDMFSIIVLVAMSTSVLAPVSLRWILVRVHPEAEELERLHREELNRENVIANVRRVLLPVRQRQDHDGLPIQTIEAAVLRRLGVGTPLNVTLFNVAEKDNPTSGAEFLAKLSRLFQDTEVSRKIVNGKNPVNAILAESRKDYDLIVLGATEKTRAISSLFNPIVDDILRLAPVPTIVVHGERIQENWIPRRILVPTQGSAASRRAAEVAFALATEGQESILILNVIEQQPFNLTYLSDEIKARQEMMARRIVDELVEVGQALRVNTSGEVKVGQKAEGEILRVARESQIDLIILGTHVRLAAGHLYLGSGVEHILRNAPCPVLLLNT